MDTMDKMITNTFPFVTSDMVGREADCIARQVCNRRPYSAAEDEEDEHMKNAREGAATGLRAGFADMAKGTWRHLDEPENRSWPAGRYHGYYRAREMVAVWLYENPLGVRTVITRPTQ